MGQRVKFDLPGENFASVGSTIFYVPPESTYPYIPGQFNVMDFRYSQEVDPTTYETHGLADGIPVRLHRDFQKEVNGALRAQGDWGLHVSPLASYQGGLGSKFSLMSVAVPECLPERLEIISYANEFAFLYDDAMEAHLDDHNTRDFGPKDDSLIDMFREGVMDHQTDRNHRPEKLLQMRVLTEMMAIDKPRAITAMKAWACFVQIAPRARARSTFESLGDYIPSRVVDVGELIWYGTVTFALALTIPPLEFDLCMKLARPGYVALALTNDLYSWAKERNAAKAAGQESVFNAIWVIMQERSRARGIGLPTEDAEAEAVGICREEIKKYVGEYRSIVENARDDAKLSKDLKAYLEAVLLTISGNLVWSIFCPRYNSEP